MCLLAGRKNAYQISHSNVTSTPPLTPDSASVQRCHSFSFHGDSTLTSSRSSYGSVGHDEEFPAPPSPTCMSKFKHVNQSSTGELSKVKGHAVSCRGNNVLSSA